MDATIFRTRSTADTAECSFSEQQEVVLRKAKPVRVLAADLRIKSGPELHNNARRLQDFCR
jgi:hypothetical protein